MEIKRIKKDNPNVNLKLEEDVNLVFFSELYNKQSINVSADFQQSLKEYTTEAISKFTKMGGKWSNDHELMLNTVLEERFAMANLVKHANIEIEKVRLISDKRAQALREKETQFHQVSKKLVDTQSTLKNAFDNNPSLHSNGPLKNTFDGLSSYITSDFIVRLEEPVKILGDFQGTGNEFNRFSSLLREK